MEIRLIDANALKFSKVAEVNGILTHVLTAEDINNATTVEIPVARRDCYCEGQKVGYEKALSERPQGDLISRKFVNEVVCEEFVDLQDGTEEWRSYVNDTCESILEKINNAPTVVYPFYQEAYQTGYEEGKNERPQGKWIYDETINNWKCSECGETPKTIGYCGNREFMTEHFKYCNHCGADMRGEK